MGLSSNPYVEKQDLMLCVEKKKEMKNEKAIKQQKKKPVDGSKHSLTV